VSNLKKVVVTVQLSGINFATSCSNGLVTIGLPAMSASLGLPESLSFWPASATALATASTLLLMGSIADALGPKWIDLLGCALCGGVMLGAGLVQTGEQLVVMRALSGVGLAMHLCSSVSIVTGILPRGRGRNIAFGCLGLSQPLGFSFGLVVGGFLVDGVGWRAGWYIYGALTILLVLIGVWAIPASALTGTLKERLKNMVKTVDWLGAILASTFMATLCYLLA
jgi:MFS family permease